MCEEFHAPVSVELAAKDPRDACEEFYAAKPVKKVSVTKEETPKPRRKAPVRQERDYYERAC